MLNLVAFAGGADSVAQFQVNAMLEKSGGAGQAMMSNRILVHGVPDTCAYRKSYPGILTVQPTEDGTNDNTARCVNGA